MDYFPAFLNLNERRCLVVGGGEVALRKVELLLGAGARVTVMAAVTNGRLQTLAAAARIEIRRQNYRDQCLAGFWLIIAATADAAVNREVAQRAERDRCWCNVVDDAVQSAFIVPAIVDRAPLTVAISSAGRSPVLARLIKARIEKILSPQLGLLADFAGRWRSRVKHAIADPAQRRRFWQRVLSGAMADRVLNMQTQLAEGEMAAALTRSQAQSDAVQQGKAFIVGAGPGNADLITVRGRAILETADVVLYDRLIAPELLAVARRDARCIYVGKQCGGAATRQEEINALLLEQVKLGHRVCRLKGGDPFLFGRGGEEIAALRDNDLPYEIVPGITAAMGCAAYAGIPLTVRGVADKVTLVTAQGHRGEPQLQWSSLARPGQTLVFYMGVRRYRHIALRLQRAGMPASQVCAIVSHGTLTDQRVVMTRLGELARAATDPSLAPAVLIVGDVAASAAANSWFGDAPAVSMSAALSA